MKKTLITLLSLAGVAMAGVDGTWAGNFSWGSGETPLTFTFDETAPISITNLTSDQAYKATNAGVYVGTYTPNVNIGNSAGTWTLSFTLTNTSSELLDIRAITLGTFLFNGSGAAQNADTFDRPVNFTVSAGDNIVTTYTAPLQGGGTAWNNSTLIDLGDSFITLDAGASVALQLKAENAQTDTQLKGTFVGLNGATFSVIPEPATATLSLLALAGLAARRRRK